MAEDDNGLHINPSSDIVITKNPGEYSWPNAILYVIGKINGKYHCVRAIQTWCPDDSSEDGDEDY